MPLSTLECVYIVPLCCVFSSCVVYVRMYVRMSSTVIAYAYVCVALTFVYTLFTIVDSTTAYHHHSSCILLQFPFRFQCCSSYIHDGCFSVVEFVYENMYIQYNQVNVEDCHSSPVLGHSDIW